MPLDKEQLPRLCDAIHNSRHKQLATAAVKYHIIATNHVEAQRHSVEIGYSNLNLNTPTTTVECYKEINNNN